MAEVAEHRIRAVAGEDRFELPQLKRVKGVCFDGVIELFPATKWLTTFTFVLSTEFPVQSTPFYTLRRINNPAYGIYWWVIEDHMNTDEPTDPSPWADDVDAWFDRNLKKGTWYMWIEE